ncbi:MAG: heme exporter protein CcmB [Actinomycetota bacterium]|nr:heme exporter protein CcmB [Acidimicrobiales bacterium]MEC8921952.1 heme exporter protein CcmB [Actinomycetota bacterium]MEC9316058.1 heme exporter protein CcmB [Actinomycetota bacterium]MED5551188.1 heme exporter protein CcmB [Actinomycetota bacterium]MEE3186418.1 heme exporter protein CcmB [Actinomycetota bacterium]
MLHEVLLVARKDLRVEWRSKVTIGQVAPLALLVLVVFAFAFDANARLLGLGAGGLFWVAVLFGGTLLIQRAFDLETDDGNFDAFRMSTIGAPSLFLGKSLGVFIQVVLLELVLGPGVALLYDVRIDDWFLLLAAALAGTVAFSVCGVLWGVMAAGVRVRATLLPLLLIPVLAPVLLAGSRAFETAFGVRAEAGWTWASVMFVIAAVHTAIGVGTFGFLLEEG